MNCITCNKELTGRQTKFCSNNCNDKNFANKNPNYFKEAQRKFREKHPERIKEQTKKYWENNKDLMNERNRNWAKMNPVYDKERKRKYQETHREQVNEMHRRWVERNPEKHKATSIRAGKKARAKFPEKVKARMYAYNHKQRADNCSRCNGTEKLNFHHTSHRKNEGYTLCRTDHNKLHVAMRECLRLMKQMTITAIKYTG